MKSKIKNYEREAFVCEVCGEKTMKLDVVNTKTDTEVYKCKSCGSYVLWRYLNTRVIKDMWDNISKERIKMIMDWNYVVKKLRY